jgi:hypothetical protein
MGYRGIVSPPAKARVRNIRTPIYRVPIVAILRDLIVDRTYDYVTCLILIRKISRSRGLIVSRVCD